LIGVLVVGANLQIKSIYDPKFHSRAICMEYSVDHCSAQIAMICNWLYHVGRKEEALKLCEKVIEAIFLC
jgi:hypothetical protein